MKLFYLTHGNVPSRWAHTVQTMKMAEALSRRVAELRVVTRAHWSRLWKPRFDYEGWYGLRGPVRVDHLYARRCPRGPLFEHVRAAGFAERAARHAQRRGADLVYTRSPFAAACAVGRGMPTLVETHLAGEEARFEKILGIARNPLLLGVVTITDELRDRYVARGVPSERILVWPDAVDLAAFEPLAPPAALREALALPRDAFLATHAGSLSEDRGIEILLQCAARMKEVTFLLVGGRPGDVARCRELARGLDNVLLTGFVANRLVPRYLAASDVLIATYSRRTPGAFYGSPMKLFEYMAARRPIVAADFPALRRHLVHERNALLVRREDARALAEGVARIQRDPALGRELAETARRDVQPLSWDARARDVLERFAPELAAR